MTNPAPKHKTTEPGSTNAVEITPNISCGESPLWIVAGPCAVESKEQVDAVAETLVRLGVGSIRGGAYKPRTSPYAFQGMEVDGLELLDNVRKQHGLAVVTEVMSETQIEGALDHCDVIQVGSRNMQNFSLLKALGEVDKPILLKRGLAATIDEFLWASEYILAGGNERVILCERGIRSYDTTTRNVLDLGGVAVLKQLSHLPVMVDPSHAAGRRDIITALARAAVAVGADGLIVEMHPNPDQSISDAAQALSFDHFEALLQEIDPVAKAVGRSIPKHSPLPLACAG